MLVAKDLKGKVTGATFSLFHKKDETSPAVGMYTYEAMPPNKEAASSLLSKTISLLHMRTGREAPVFMEGNTKNKASDEVREFRVIGYDNKQYKWCSGKYRWMVYGDAAPSLKEMQTAIYLQRNFVVQAEDPKYIDACLPLTQQVQGLAREEYEVDKSVAHARDIAVNGQMELEPPLVKLNRTVRKHYEIHR